MFSSTMNFTGFVGVVLLGLNLLNSSDGTADCDFDCIGKMEEEMFAFSMARNNLRSEQEPISAGKIKFLLYIRDKEQHPEEYTAFSEQKNEVFYNLNPNLTTKIVIHGWKGFVPSLFTDVMKDAYLPKYDYNLIMIDWSEAGAKMLYPWAKSHIPMVAETLAAFIDLLYIRHGIRPESLHLLGHSLGAHIAGVAGRHVTTGVIGRITGLDPAEPLLDRLNPEQVLSKGSAKFVDVIHTCGMYLGFQEPLGHVDFYPNGGHFIQPGCGIDPSGACSHRRSYGYYSESIRNPDGFLAYPCSSWLLYYLGLCSKGPRVLMGEDVPIGTKGTYYLDTNSKSPFSQK